MNHQNTVGETCPPNLSAPKSTNSETLATPNNTFFASQADRRFLFFCIGVGFFFTRWLLWTGFKGYGVTLFTFAFAAGVLQYAKTKHIIPSSESWFWMAIMLLCSLPFALWPAGLLQTWQTSLLLGSAVYWVAHLFGTLVLQKASNLLLFDFINIAFFIPFHNRRLPLKINAATTSSKSGPKITLKHVGAILIGLFLCIPFLAIVLPLLLHADAGGFKNALLHIRTLMQTLHIGNVNIFIIQIIISIPIIWYFASMLLGSADKRHIKNIDFSAIEKTKTSIRLIPKTTVLVLLCVASAVYMLFIVSQIPYFFSAFAGIKPEGFTEYSSYAREGFFELCRIAFINLGLLALTGCLCQTPIRESKSLRFANVMLSSLTLLILVTAFSKMALYILTPAAHGLTPKRLMTCVFMLFLAGVCLAVIAFQFKYFSLMRFSSILGATLLCALCLCNMNNLVAQYNASRYLNGSLSEFNTQIIVNGGPAGLPAALKVYNSLNDETDVEERQNLAYAINAVYVQAKHTQGSTQDTLTNIRTRTKYHLL